MKLQNIYIWVASICQKPIDQTPQHPDPCQSRARQHTSLTGSISSCQFEHLITRQHVQHLRAVGVVLLTIAGAATAKIQQVSSMDYKRGEDLVFP